MQRVIVCCIFALALMATAINAEPLKAKCTLVNGAVLPCDVYQASTGDWMVSVYNPDTDSTRVQMLDLQMVSNRSWLNIRPAVYNRDDTELPLLMAELEPPSLHNG